MIWGWHLNSHCHYRFLDIPGQAQRPWHASSANLRRGVFFPQGSGFVPSLHPKSWRDDHPSSFIIESSSFIILYYPSLSLHHLSSSFRSSMPPTPYHQSKHTILFNLIGDCFQITSTFKRKILSLPGVCPALEAIWSNFQSMDMFGAFLL